MRQAIGKIAMLNQPIFNSFISVIRCTQSLLVFKIVQTHRLQAIGKTAMLNQPMYNSFIPVIRCTQSI